MNLLINSFWQNDSVRFTLFLGISSLYILLTIVFLDKLSTKSHELKFCGFKVPVIEIYKIERLTLKNGESSKEEQGTPYAGREQEPNAKQKANLNRKKLRQNFGEEWQDLFERLEIERELNTNNSEKIKEPMAKTQATKSYKHRKRRHKDILTRDVFPTLKNIDQSFDLILKNATSELRQYQLRNSIIQSYRYGKPMPDFIASISKKTKGQKKILHFSKQDRQKYFDSTIAQSKIEQLQNFQQFYFNYDPNTGDLPQAMRELYLKNLQRLLFQFSYDPSYRVLDYMEEALNKEDFLINMQSAMSKYYGTKLGDEILLALENIYEIQQNALIELMLFAQSYNLSTNDPIRKVTLRKLAERVLPLAEKKGLYNPKDVQKAYSKRRREILNAIIQKGNSRENEARFLLGKLEWQIGKIDSTQFKKHWKRALQHWKSITQINPQFFAYNETFQMLKPLLKKFSFNYDNESANKIEFLLQNTDKARIIQKRKRELELLWKDKEDFKKTSK